MLGAFSMYDVDNDGYVTKDEMLKVVEAICSSKTSSINGQQTNLARQRVENIFITMDSVSPVSSFKSNSVYQYLILG